MFRYKTTDPMLIPYSAEIKSNYNDNGLNCGGKQTQIQNGGRCGVCGDSFTATEKENEAGGKYARGIITRNYDRGQYIDVKVELTAAHKGYYEFRLCPWNNVDEPVTHECLNQNLLNLEEGDTKWYIPKVSPRGIHEMKVKLPDDVTCDQCVFQWRYRTGNSWGEEDGRQGVGLGQQEEFYGCSDVAIRDADETSNTGPSTTTRKPSTTTRRPSTTTRKPSTTTRRPSTTTRKPSTTTTQRPTVAPTKRPMTPPIGSYPDCNVVPLGQTIWGSCQTFFICAHRGYAPFEFRCPPGTVCDPRSGRCDFAYSVARPCGTM